MRWLFLLHHYLSGASWLGKEVHPIFSKYYPSISELKISPTNGFWRKNKTAIILTYPG